MDAREIALKVINDVTSNHAYANIALVRELNRHKVSDQDRRFITELVYGTIKAGETLDWIIGHYVTRSLNKVAPVILNILRMGMYQIFFLSKVPVSAACNQAVELTKKYGHIGTVKFVNAVLRNAGRGPEKVVYPDREKNIVKFLALKYFHPQWMVARWVKRLGPEATEELCQINNVTPALSLRTNTLKNTREELLNILEQEGVSAEPSEWTPEGIVCHSYPALSTLKSLRDGLFQIQDESSMLVAHILAPNPGEFIIDACVGDKYARQADKVLVDAPCSGLGVLRRKADSRWRKNETMFQELPVLQKAILKSAAECVKIGGILVYSTCTTEPEENQKVVEDFLQENQDFALEHTGGFFPVKRYEGDMVQLWPHIDHVDGFFISRLVRVK
jgi:16S rRNA (cytosine967-C5)-methyltransferase